ncbi:MAG: hypothetical protein KIS85_09790 [Anaerolineales bacterium]|nr:hypothetical protein [Anaerolineales bacterium]
MFVTCPWCGTNHPEFQSNCKNCGAPLPTPQQQAAERARSALPQPPPPPREMSSRFIWRWMMTDGWTIGGFVLLMFGISLAPAGLGLIAGLITAFVGIPLFFIGLVILAGGMGVFYWRYTLAQKLLNVLRHGRSTTGEITQVQQNHSVQINGRSPWNIDYVFKLDGKSYGGTVITLNTPDEHLKKGSPAVVLYLPEEPEYNGLYPHP